MNPKHPLDPPMTLGNMRLIVRHQPTGMGEAPGACGQRPGRAEMCACSVGRFK